MTDWRVAVPDEVELCGAIDPIAVGPDGLPLLYLLYPHATDGGLSHFQGL